MQRTGSHVKSPQPGSMSAPAPPAHPATRGPRSTAVRDIAAVAPGVIAFGITLGVAAATTGTGAGPALVGAALVYGGSAQLSAITALHLGSGLLAAVVAGAVVNARLLLYSAALAPRFRGQPAWFRILGPQFIVDQTYLATMRHDFEGAAFRRYWAWLGLALLAVWTASVTLGLLAAPLLPPLPHLWLVGSALFVALLVPRVGSRSSVVGVVVAGGTAVLVSRLAPELGILAGTIAGLVASVTSGPKEADS